MQRELSLKDQAELKQEFLNKVAEAKVSNVKQIELPREVYKEFFKNTEFEDTTNIIYENVRVFVEGTVHDTLAKEAVSMEQKNFGVVK